MQPKYIESEEASYNVTELSNGFTVLTESQIFPSTINMGKSPSTRLPRCASVRRVCGHCYVLNYNSGGDERTTIPLNYKFVTNNLFRFPCERWFP
jgi:hypothetical protein